MQITLEAAVAVARVSFVAPDDDVRRARGWLVTAYSNKPHRVDHAIGPGSARDMFERVDAIEGNVYTSLWKAIIKLDCAERYPLLEAYKSMYESVPGQRRRLIQRVTRVNQFVIETSLNECLRENVEQERLATDAARAALERQIRDSEKLLQRNVSKAAKQRLDRDLSILKAARRVF